MLETYSGAESISQQFFWNYKTAYWVAGQQNTSFSVRDLLRLDRLIRPIEA